jgi:phosphatidylglycerophosphatase A
MIRAITTFGVGLLRPAPAHGGRRRPWFWDWRLTVIWALALVIALLGVTALGFWAVPRELAGRPGEDPSEIVIDEVAGQWLALIFTGCRCGGRGGQLGAGAWPGWVAAFVCFSGCSTSGNPGLWAGPTGGAMRPGVMLDDLWAGLFAGPRR